MGSWQWAVPAIPVIPATGADPDPGRRFPAFLPSPDEVVRMTDVNRAIPATGPALDRAVEAIDQDLADHQYYPPTGR
ncbi:hypothetical protein OHB14_45520 [Streptomyces sp. NBC_01613]|uniref:hypothetical protein n=1 Tax=Streptomyces sp. NBC_01613 TaxID=2975896 RepID=UPI00386563E8